MSRPQRMPRPVFEALVWQHARHIASTSRRERDASMRTVMAAFDTATGRRAYRPQPVVDVRAQAEIARQCATALNGDTPSLAQARRAELHEAVSCRRRLRVIRPAPGERAA